jgi:O-antigen ligase
LVRIPLALAALLGALPFLFSEHRLPLPSFYDEWLGAALATLAGITFCFSRKRDREALPELSLWLALFAGWLALQAVLREPAYLQLPAAGIVYVLLAAQAAWLGRALAERHGDERVVDVLAWTIFAGATLNAAIGILQFYGVPEVLRGVIATPAGPRSIGHVGQANLFTEYIALGQASLLYLVARERLRGIWWWGPALMLVLASAYSLSRSAIVFSCWIFAAAFWLRSRGPQWQRLARHAGALALASVIAALAIPRLHDAVEDRILALQDARPAAWALAWRLFADSPGLGVGWGEFAGAAFRAGLGPALGAHDNLWTSPHNLFLQLAAEAGVIGVGLILLAALRWGHRVWIDLRHRATLPAWWVAAAAGTIGLDALIQYPLWYAHVLVLAALIAGIASRSVASVPAAPLRLGLLAAGALAGTLLIWALRDYQRFDRAYVTASGRTLAPATEVSAALDELRALAHGPLGAQVAPWLYASDPAASQAAGERALRRWPSPQVIARHAVALELSGQRAAADQLLDFAFRTQPASRARLERALEQQRSASAR